MKPLRTRRDYNEASESVNPYLNTPPTKLKRDLKNQKDKSKRKKMQKALNAWRLTVPGPWRINAAKEMIRIAKILLT